MDSSFAPDFQAIVHNMPHGAIIQDAAGQVLYTNPAAGRLSGLPLDLLLGREILPGWSILREDCSPLAAQDLPPAAALRSGQPQHAVVGFRDPAGQVAWVKYVSTLQFDPPGGPLRCVVTGLDEVTAQQALKDTLQTNEEIFKLSLEYSPAAIAMLDTELRFLAVSRRYLSNFHLEGQQVLGRTFEEVFPHLTEEEKQTLRRCLAGETAQAQDYPFIVPDGCQEWLRWEILPWYLPAGQQGGLLLFSEVITARRAAEERLRDAQAHLDLAVQSANIGFWDLDLGSNQVTYSSGWKRQLGYAEDEIGDSFSEWETRVHPDDLAAAMKKFSGYLAQPYPYYWNEFRLRHKDGSYRWILAQGSLLYDAEGRPARMSGSHIDVTESKRTSQALLETRERLQRLFESTDGLVAEFDADGRILYLNEAGARFWQSTPLQLTGKLMSDFLPPDFGRKRLEDIRQVLATGQGQISEQSGVLPDGQLHIFRSSLQPIRDAAGRPHSVVLFSNEITELKLAQQRLAEQTAELRKANAELQRANSAKSEFLSMMSHELRTPLSTIQMIAESMQDGIYGEVNSRQSDRLTSLRQAGAHLLELIGDILDFSGLEAGAYAIRPEAVDLNALCLQAIEMVKPQAVQKKQFLSTYIQSTDLPVVTDPARLKQVLINLLGNAVKFTPPEGKIGLETVFSPQEGSVKVTVWDSGIGIPPERSGQLFQPFSQLDSALNRRFEGAGLSLALSKRLVELLGGSIGLESAPGQGSRFWLSLPLVHPAARQAVRQEDSPPSAAPGAAPGPDAPLILVVEDTLDNLDCLAELLSLSGYRVARAMHGAEALRLVQEQPPDAILMDIQMPVMDGLEAAHRLRALPPFAATSIIAMTALVMPGDRERCLAAGMDAYLAKPINLQQLCALLPPLP